MRHAPSCLAALSLILAAPAAAQTPPAPAATPAPAPDLSRLTAQHRTALQCAAAFAIAALEQQKGGKTALGFPPLGYRGKEYFVRTSARVEDEAGLTREQVRDLLVADVAALQKRATATKNADATLAAAVGPCLPLLDAAVPPLQTPDLVTCAAIMRDAYDEIHASEGLSARAKDVGTLAAVLEDRARKDMLSHGKSGNEADQAMEQAREALAKDAAASPTGGANRYDLATCYDLAKPGPQTHY